MVAALDKRIGDVTGTINTRGAEVADAISAKIGDMDKTLGARAMEVADTLDSRITRFEELLVGRAVTVTDQIESRTKAAADTLSLAHGRVEPGDQDQRVGSRKIARRARDLDHRLDPLQRQRSRTHADRRVSDEIARSFVVPRRGDRRRGQPSAPTK